MPKLKYSNSFDPDAVKHGQVGVSAEVYAYHQKGARDEAQRIYQRCKNNHYASLVAAALSEIVLEHRGSETQQEARPDWRESFVESLTNKGGE